MADGILPGSRCNRKILGTTGGGTIRELPIQNPYSNYSTLIETLLAPFKEAIAVGVQ